MTAVGSARSGVNLVTHARGMAGHTGDQVRRPDAILRRLGRPVFAAGAAELGGTRRLFAAPPAASLRLIPCLRSVNVTACCLSITAASRRIQH